MPRPERYFRQQIALHRGMAVPIAGLPLWRFAPRCRGDVPRRMTYAA